jgi:hypothetical protein
MPYLNQAARVFSDERGIPESSGTIFDLKLPLYK